MRRLALILVAAAVMLVPRQSAEAIAFSTGRLDPGTRLLFDLRTDGYPRIKLDVRLAESGTSLITVGDRLIDLEFPMMLRKPVVPNVTFQSSEVTFLGGLVIDKLSEKKASHRVPWLSDLPEIGKLFRSQVEDTTASLLLFLTPAIVTGPQGKKTKEVEGYAGDFRVDDAKGKGSVRIVRNFTKYKGSWVWKVEGTWLSGPAAGKPFKATIKGKLKGTRT